MGGGINLSLLIRVPDNPTFTAPTSKGVLALSWPARLTSLRPMIVPGSYRVPLERMLLVLSKLGQLLIMATNLLLILMLKLPMEVVASLPANGNAPGGGG